MIWRTAPPWLILGGMVCCAAALIATKAEASQARYTAIKSMEGLHERTNRTSIRKRLGVDPARVPWCGYAIAYSVRKAGGKPVKGYPKAVNWSRFGKAVKLSSARRGDIVVIRTKRGHHVTIYSHRTKGRVCGIGGNQSNRVKVSCYRASSVRSVRR